MLRHFSILTLILSLLGVILAPALTYCAGSLESPSHASSSDDGTTDTETNPELDAGIIIASLALVAPLHKSNALQHEIPQPADDAPRMRPEQPPKQEPILV